MVNKNTEQLKEYIDEKVLDIQRPGGLNYSNVGVGREYQAVVTMDAGNGGFTDIKSAINYVSNSGGGKILIKIGTYEVNSVLDITSSGVEIYGENRYKSVIRVAGTANIGTVINIGGKVGNVILSNFTIDGNKASQTSGSQNLIWYHATLPDAGTNMILENMNFVNQYGNTGACVAGDKDRAVIRDCYFGTCDGWAVYSNSMNDTVIDSCYAENCGGGFFLGNFNRITNSTAGTINTYNAFNLNYGGGQMSNCYAVVCSGTYVRVESNDCSILNNRILISSPSSTDAIVLDGNSCLVNNNSIELNVSGTYADATYSGIVIKTSSFNNNVIGNNIDATSGTFNLAYGILESGTASTGNAIIGNVILGAGTGVGTAGATSVVANNVVL